MNPIQILLRNSIDYAGLFPPAGLDMESAVANYARYRTGPDAWALGRFVVPAARISEFEAAARPHLSEPTGNAAWQLSALIGAELDAEVAAILEFNARHEGPGAPRLAIDSLEFKATSSDAMRDSMRRVPRHLQAYIEIPIDGDPAGLINAIARSGGRAKVRAGGVTPDAFPSASDVVRFIQRCLQAGVAFKATAGLHHPLRAEYRLTYAEDSPRGLMFGFLNLFLTTGFLQAGMGPGEAERLLEETSLETLRIDDQAIYARGQILTQDDLRRMRREGLVSFGSCSFTEPIEELQALHLLGSGVRT